MIRLAPDSGLSVSSSVTVAHRHRLHLIAAARVCRFNRGHIQVTPQRSQHFRRVLRMVFHPLSGASSSGRPLGNSCQLIAARSAR